MRGSLTSSALVGHTREEHLVQYQRRQGPWGQYRSRYEGMPVNPREPIPEPYWKDSLPGHSIRFHYGGTDGSHKRC